LWWSISPGMPWSVSPGMGGQLAPECGGHVHQNLHPSHPLLLSWLKKNDRYCPKLIC